MAIQKQKEHYIVYNKALMDGVIFTTTQIAEKTGIDLDAVRYRLNVLRRRGLIIGTKIGNSWVYGEIAIEKVEKFTRKGYDC